MKPVDGNGLAADFFGRGIPVMFLKGSAEPDPHLMISVRVGLIPFMDDDRAVVGDLAAEHVTYHGANGCAYYR